MNAGGSAIRIHKDLLPDGAMVTHVVTCQGRDHIVSGDRNLVVVHVHFEPDLTLRRMRERFRLITPYWPLYPEGIGVITGDSNICGTEEGRFNVCFTEGDTIKSAHFHSFFPRVLEIAQPEHDILHERFHVTHFCGLCDSLQQGHLLP